MDALHHSFKEFSHTSDPTKLPFNASPDRTEGAGEANTFLSLPVKRNARQLKNKAQTSLFSKPETEYAFLDFEHALRESIGHNVRRDTEATRKRLENDIKDKEAEKKAQIDERNAIYAELKMEAPATVSEVSEVRPAVSDRLEIRGYLPSAEQWYLLNQLRGKSQLNQSTPAHPNDPLKESTNSFSTLL
jgi:hypothetical protein